MIKTRFSEEGIADCKIIMSVMESYRLVKDRVKKLQELGYEVRQQWVSFGGIGTIRSYGGKNGMQFSSTTATCGYKGLAYVAYPKSDSMAEFTADKRRTWLMLKRLEKK